MAKRGGSQFNIRCRRCPRLASFLDEVKADYPDYYCRPVPAFGDPEPRLLIVGLAPGKHGANRSGRPFTGDFAGILLYKTLHSLGLASAPESLSVDDGLTLTGARLTNAVKCLPPDNKPVTDEVKECSRYLNVEIEALSDDSVILALGKIAHDAVLRTLGLKLSGYKFAHEAVHRLPSGRVLVNSYHCSRYNTQTNRLTEKMFKKAVTKAWKLSTATAAVSR